MTDSITVTLAGKPYTIQQLTIGQQCDLSIGVMLPGCPDPQEAVKRNFDRWYAIAAAALREDNPDLTIEALKKMRVTRKEMREANEAILRFAGLILVEEAKPGEAEAGAASTGPTSSAD